MIKRLKNAPDISGGEKKAAVVVLYTTSSNPPEILFVVRKISERDRWSGHVAFPGGRWEPKDKSLLDTAMRELLEETGLRLDKDMELVDILSEVSPKNEPELKVIPFLARTSSKPLIRLSEELSTYFWASIKDLEKMEAIVELPDGSKKSVLGFRSGNWIIWGMTARILEQALPIISRTL
ncbi:MAG: CoA pyrophosphatase [Aigarchaeota archaeon]|nr:CoA pyrophosphatase [Aigarchaeota archaeon]MCX8192327.1 CoA pyrophosphatase [Nitrososphaeria archaeon]MDW7986851.1 CoA pyrophosphatase [Nitrososphaerota archaeon]